MNEEKRQYEEGRFTEFNCHNCGGRGHVRRECPSKLRVQDLRQRLNSKVEPSAKSPRYGEWYTNGVITRKWIIDSGASAHMCGDKNSFNTLDDQYAMNIVVANGETMECKGMGTINVEVYTRNGPFKVELKDVLYVPSIDENLISVRAITKRGFSVIFKESGCYIDGDQGEMMIGKVSGNLWVLNEYNKNHQARETNSYCIHEWHRRMSHRNLEDIKQMQKELKSNHAITQINVRLAFKEKHHASHFQKGQLL